jgi:hypothetical protein
MAGVWHSAQDSVNQTRGLPEPPDLMPAVSSATHPRLDAGFVRDLAKDPQQVASEKLSDARFGVAPA